jgi:SAM-dependent methyltransferase
MFSGNKSSRLDPRHYQPALPVPVGYTKAQILETFVSLSIDGSATGELTGYATTDCERFLYTLDLLPESAGGELLEIGANPYFNTLLFKHFRPRLNLSLTNYFGGQASERVQHLQYRGFDRNPQRLEARYLNCNSESEPLPYADKRFDWIVFCEVLEHMTNDPMHVLLELKRVLKPGGQLILTTPNAARLENVIAFLEGRNIYDPYSGYGPYGRHNREYTRHELHELMKHCGFVNAVSFTGNVHDDILGSLSSNVLETLLGAVQNRQHDLGQYLFTRWSNDGVANLKKPNWLYRSYAADQLT